MGNLRRNFRVFLHFTAFWAFLPGTPANSHAAVIEEDGNRIRVGDPLQDRWMSSTNWPEDHKLKDAETLLLPEKKMEKNSFRVFIDPGHGGKDTGAVGPRGMNESGLCLKIAKRVQVELLKAGKYRKANFEVMMSRQGDEFLSLKDRYLAANTWDADLFVSIHANSSPSAKPRGFEVYFLSSEASDETARHVVSKENAGETKKDSLVNSILADSRTAFHVRESSSFAESVFGGMSRSIRPNVRAVRQGPFTVLAGTEMPAVLVEVGYLSHLGEAMLLTKEPYLNRVASAISSGIIEFFVSSRRLNPKKNPRQDLVVSRP